jgi:cytosine deaminase
MGNLYFKTTSADSPGRGGADWLIRRALISGGNQEFDIGMANGCIVSVEPHSEIIDAARTLEANGRLLLPGLVDVHMHLDKAWLNWRVVNFAGTHTEASEVMTRAKRNFTPSDIHERATQVIRLAVANGTTAIRTHVDVDTVIGLTAFEVLSDLRRSLSHIVDLQLAPITRSEIVDDPGGLSLVRRALASADAIGGYPVLARAGRDHLKLIFRLAQEYDLDIDVHMDESDDPSQLLIEDLIKLTERQQYIGRVTAGHLCSLSAVRRSRALRIIDGIKAAGINVVTLPSANLFLQGRGDEENMRRGVTRVKELLAAGVNVAAASDNVRDAFCPFGNADLLQIGVLLAHAAHMGSPTELATIVDMISQNPSRIFWRGAARTLTVGEPADVVLFDCTSLSDLILSQPSRLAVFKRGRLVAQTSRTVTYDSDLTLGARGGS